MILVSHREVRQKPKLQNELSKLIEQKEFGNFSDL
jgi:hypothetical protein